MTDSHRFMAHLGLLLTHEQMRWLREDAPKGDGTKGWIGTRVTLFTAQADGDALRDWVSELRASGKTNAEIADEVCRSKSRVEHLVSEMGLT